jgi:TonB family protein
MMRRMRTIFAILGSVGLALVALLGSAGTAAQESADARWPKVLFANAPPYPAVAAAARAFGTVVVVVKIDADGQVTTAKARSGHPLLAKASEKAAEGWRFEVSTDGQAERGAELTFEYDAECANTETGKQSQPAPYHVVIRNHHTPAELSDTESHIPPDSVGKRCPVHGEWLRRDKVDIAYGLIDFKPAYLKAEKRSFPYANEVAYGGCVIWVEINPCTGARRQGSPRFAEVLYCTRCRAAKAQWSKAHPRGRS